MNLKSVVFLAAICGGSALAASAMAAPSVGDYSFESPSTSGYDYGQAGNGAVFNSGAGVAANGSAFGYANAVDGNQVAHLQNGGTASLSISGLTIGTNYAFSFYGASRPSYAVAPIDVSFDGTDLGTYTPGSASFTQVTTDSFLADVTDGVLTFSVLQNTGSDINSALDDVTIGEVSAAPEPSTWALMLGGIGILGGMMRVARARRREDEATGMIAA